MHRPHAGSVGALKAIISESSNNSNQAIGVSILSVGWGLGVLIGPAISGAVSDPIGQYNLTIESNKLATFRGCMHDIVLIGTYL